MSIKRQIKQSVVRAIRKAVGLRFYLDKIRRIQKKIDYLRDKKLYQPFPDTTVHPTIYDYPFYRKQDKAYLDFFFSVSANADKDYIPLTTYFMVIEPLINQLPHLSAIADKNAYDLYFRQVNTPTTYLRKIDGTYYDKEYSHVEKCSAILSKLLDRTPSLILKPSIESGSGKSIELFTRHSDRFLSEEKTLDAQFLDRYPDFVLQENVVQHTYFRQFNPSSNNTIRILTYRSVTDDRIHVLHRLLRVGKRGSFLDHDNLGGIAVGISAKSRLNSFGFDSLGNKFTTFNNVNLGNQDPVPFMAEIEEIAAKIAERVFYGRLLAFDFTVDRSGVPLLIEINCWRNGVSQYQMNNGSLFQDFTNEILDYCVGKESRPIYRF